MKYLLCILCLLVSLPAAADKPAVGTLKYEMPEAQVKKLLGPPANKIRETEEMATGLFISEWKYPTQGLTLTMSCPRPGEPRTLYRVHLVAPGLAQPGRGGIGASATDIEAHCRKLYAADKDATIDVSPEYVSVSWEQLWAVLTYELKNGKVSAVFLGPGPE